MMKQVYLFLAAMLLLCLAPMPYGYFMLVRYVMMLACGWMAYRYYVNQKWATLWTFVALVLLFQPIVKIALGRMLWNVIDVAVAAFLVAMFVMEKKLEKKGSAPRTPLPADSNEKIDNRVEFGLECLLGPKELVYVASEEDKALAALFENRPEVFEGWGQMYGFHIIYLPTLIKKLRDKRVLQYRAPYLSEAELADVSVGNDFLLQYLCNPSDKKKIKQGFIRTEDIHRGSDGKDKATNRFYPLSTTSGEPLADQLLRIGRQIALERTDYELSLESNLLEADEWDDYDNIDSPYEPSELGFHSQQEEETVDDLMEEVRERIAKLRQRGIAEHLLEQLIHPDNRLSRMVITKDWRIMLPDYNDMEIKMEPLVKAVYLLFLRHSEGIIFKNLPEYRRELTEIYSKLRPLGLTDRALRSIEDVTNPLLNSINEKCARIRGAFVGQFDNYMAKSYYVDGVRGEAKKIGLPRSLVVWEADAIAP